MIVQVGTFVYEFVHADGVCAGVYGLFDCFQKSLSIISIRYLAKCLMSLCTMQ